MKGLHHSLKNSQTTEQSPLVYSANNNIKIAAYPHGLITCGRTNELAHALLTDYTRLFVQLCKPYGWQNGTRQYYTTLPGSTESYGKRTQTRTFENHAN